MLAVVRGVVKNTGVLVHGKLPTVDTECIGAAAEAATDETVGWGGVPVDGGVPAGTTGMTGGVCVGEWVAGGIVADWGVYGVGAGMGITGGTPWGTTGTLGVVPVGL